MMKQNLFLRFVPKPNWPLPAPGQKMSAFKPRTREQFQEHGKDVQQLQATVSDQGKCKNVNKSGTKEANIF